MGEPNGSLSLRVQVLSEVLSRAGFDAPIREDIRWNVWLQFWGNICFTPISALTCTTLDRITTDTGLRALCKAMMAETQAVNEAHGIHIPSEMADRRLAAAASTIGHKMSMLQDPECGRSMEIDPRTGTASRAENTGNRCGSNPCAGGREGGRPLSGGIDANLEQAPNAESQVRELPASRE